MTPSADRENTEESPAGAPTVETRTEFEAALATDGRALVDFYAEWCGPCETVTPEVDALAAATDQPVLKVDVESLPAVAAEHGVQAIPTFVVFEGGEEVDRLRGVYDEAQLRAALHE